MKRRRHKNPDGQYVHICQTCGRVMGPTPAQLVVWFCDCPESKAQQLPRVSTQPQPAAPPRVRMKKVCRHLGELLPETFPPKDGAGDALERGLSAFGITKERWAAVVAAFVPEDNDGKGCGGCEKRQQQVNHVGRAFGIGKKSAEIRALLNLSEGQTLPVHACAVHGRCVPSKAYLTIEGAPHSCHGCKAVDLVEIALPAPAAAQ